MQSDWCVNGGVWWICNEFNYGGIGNYGGICGIFKVLVCVKTMCIKLNWKKFIYFALQVLQINARNGRGRGGLEFAYFCVCIMHSYTWLAMINAVYRTANLWLCKMQSFQNNISMSISKHCIYNAYAVFTYTHLWYMYGFSPIPLHWWMWCWYTSSFVGKETATYNYTDILA